MCSTPRRDSGRSRYRLLRCMKRVLDQRPPSVLPLSYPPPDFWSLAYYPLYTPRLPHGTPQFGSAFTRRNLGRSSLAVGLFASAPVFAFPGIKSEKPSPALYFLVHIEALPAWTHSADGKSLITRQI